MISRYGWCGAAGCARARGLRRRTTGARGRRGAAAAGGRAPGRIVFLGTSLTAGLGLDPEQAYPALIQREDRFRRPSVRGGQRGGERRDLGRRAAADRLAAAAAGLGAGDRDRRQRRASRARTGLAARQHPGIIDRGPQASRRRRRSCCVGMRAPPNLGFGYARRFRDVYPDLAEKNDLPLVPFLLEGRGRGRLAQPVGHDPSRPRRARSGWRRRCGRCWSRCSRRAA